MLDPSQRTKSDVEFNATPVAVKLYLRARAHLEVSGAIIRISTRNGGLDGEPKGDVSTVRWIVVIVVMTHGLGSNINSINNMGSPSDPWGRKRLRKTHF